ncbi:hypothetical protein B0H14DRAFT_3072377 [Mycena olivaceomarginata]|nr:hypothetical protein B0H14DRAFT_3072377 [Mycena olivaceomarginata]
MSSSSMSVNPASSGILSSKLESILAAEHLTGQLELRISANSVGLYPSPPTHIVSDFFATQAMSPQPPPASNHDAIRLLSGPLAAFLKYSRHEQSQWLMNIAHDMCDPAAMRGSLFVWDEATEQWSPVAPTDPLTASVYLYRVPAGVIVALSKMSARTGRSVTSATGNASTMADRVKRRDGGMCWVTGSVDPVINSHICPKRMGDHLARVVCRNFLPGSPPIPNLSIYDERFGITLSTTLDPFFDMYQLGLRFVAVNQYECHAFMAEIPGRVHTIAGAFTLPTIFPIIHGLTAGPPHPQLAHNPPPGLIRWHYLQCVLKKFGHAEYKNLPNIRYSELPFRMEGDSDDDGTDSEAEWPSAALDRGRAVQASFEEKEHLHSVIADWITTV